MYDQIPVANSAPRLSEAKTPDRSLVLAALFLLVFGAQSVLVGNLGSPLPHGRQWDAEAANLLRPYLDGTLGWQQLFAFDGGSRPVFARLLTLGLFEISGGWDPVLEMLINATLHAAFAAAFAAVLLAMVPGRARLLVFAFIALCLVLPVGFENALQGMNSSIYLLLLFSLISTVCMARADGFSGQWWLGLVFAIAAGFTIPSGALTALAAAIVPILQLAVGVRPRRRREVLAIAVTVVVGLIIGFAALAQDPAVRAQNILEFLSAIVAVGSLPLATVAGLIVVHAPIGWLLFHLLRSHPPRQASAWGVVALAVWVVAEVLAIAYAEPDMVQSSRYLDIVVLLLPLDLVALSVAMDEYAGLRRVRWLVAYGGIWIFLIVAGISGESYLNSLREAVGQKAALDHALPVITGFLRTGDAAPLQALSPLAYPDPDRLAGFLADPKSRLVLPEVLRLLDIDPFAAQQKSLLMGRLSGVAAVLKLLLAAGPIWLAFGIALGLLAGARATLRSMSDRRTN